MYGDYVTGSIMIAVVFFMCYDIFILAFSDGEMNNNTT
jgi:hypothetical protein